MSTEQNKLTRIVDEMNYYFHPDSPIKVVEKENGDIHLVHNSIELFVDSEGRLSGFANAPIKGQCAN